MICFSPDPAPPAGAVQDCGQGKGIDIDSPPLAQPAVGGRSGQYVSAAALGAASTERPPNAGAQDRTVWHPHPEWWRLRASHLKGAGS